MARVRRDNDSRYALRASFVDENGDVITGDTITIGSASGGISATDVANWNEAYGWGDHAQAGYGLAANDFWTAITGGIEYTGGTATVDNVVLGGSGTIAGLDWTKGTFHLGSATSGWAMDANELYNSGSAIIGTIADNSSLTLNPKGAITTSRPFVSTNTITANTGDSNQWSQAFGWGDHASAGYGQASDDHWSINGTSVYYNGGNVGIGTSTPSNYTAAPNLVVDTGLNGGISIIGTGATGSYGGLYFGDGVGGDAYRGFVQYNHDNASSTDVLLFGSASQERMRIDSSGHVGIGTSSPSAALTVRDDTASADTIVVDRFGIDRVVLNNAGVVKWGSQANQGELTWDTGKTRVVATAGNTLELGANGSLNDLVIDSSGHVGIGINDPGTSRLAVKGTSAYGSGLRVFSDDSASNWARVDLQNANDPDTFILYRDQGGNVGMRNNVTSPEGSKQFTFVAGNDVAGTFAWETKVGTEALRIDSAGRVGIGQTAPSNLLHLKGDPKIRLEDASPVAASILDGSSGNLLLRADVNAQQASTYIAFLMDGDSEKMRIDSNGHVGIGTGATVTAAHFTVDNGGEGTVAAFYGSIDGYTRPLQFKSYNPASASGAGWELDVASSQGEFKFTNNSRTLMHAKYNGDVGIGADAYSNGSYRVLQVKSEDTLAGGYIRLASTTNGAHTDVFNYNGNLYHRQDGQVIFQDTAATDRMRLIGDDLVVGDATAVTSGCAISVFDNGGTLTSDARIGFNGRAAFGYDGTRNAVLISDAPSGTTSTKPIVFDTAGSERVRIDTSGRLGIGDSAPSEALSVAGNIDATGAIRGTTTTGAGTPTFSFGADPDTGMYHVKADTLGFATGGSEAMRISTNGDVGIGGDGDDGTNYRNLLIKSDHTQTGGQITLSTSDGDTTSIFNYTAAASPGMYYMADTHVFRNSAGTNRMVLSSAGDITSVANITASGTVQGAAVTATGNITGADITASGAMSCASLTATGDVTAFSDERLKSDVQTLDGSKAFDLRGVSFTKDGRLSSGVIAQEVEAVAPELVHTNEDGYKSVAYGNLVGYLIEAVKELKAEIEELKNGASN